MVTCKDGLAPLLRPSLRRYYFSLVILIGDNSDLLFYLHMTKNEYKILVSTKPTKASLGVRRKFSLDYFGRMIVDLLGGFV